MKLLTTILLCLPLLMIAQTKDVGSFDAVVISHGIKAHLEQSNQERVSYKIVKGDESDIKISNINNKLIVSRSKPAGKRQVEITATIYYKSLNDIEIKHGSHVQGENLISCRNMDIEVLHGSYANLEIEATDASIEVGHGSSLVIEGNAAKAEIEAAHGSSCNGMALDIQQAEIEASSGSSVKINVEESINAEASNGSTIKYYGKPSIRSIEKDNSSTVSPR